MSLGSENAIRAIAFVEDEHSMGYDAQLLHTTLSTTLTRYHELDSYFRRPGSDRRRSTTTGDDHFLQLQIFLQLTHPAVQVRNCLEQVCGLNVSE